MRRLSAAIVVMLAVTVSTSVWASCMAEIGMAESAQMACCEHGHDKCPMRESPESCCQLEGQRHAQISVATLDLARPVLNPPTLLPAAVPASFVPVVVRVSQPTSSHDILKGPSPPPYLAGSAFLV